MAIGGTRVNPSKFHKNQIPLYLYLVPIAIFMGAPIIYIINHAFKPMDELFAFPPKRAPGTAPKAWGKPALRLAGTGIGCLSALVGIGGGSLSVPLLLRAGATMAQAAGTSSSMGLPIALGGAVGYVVNGLGAPGLPEHALGYVHLPALAGIAAVSVCAAPVGVALAHRLPAPALKRVFSVLLLAGAAKMVLSVL